MKLLNIIVFSFFLVSCSSVNSSKKTISQKIEFSKYVELEKSLNEIVQKNNFKNVLVAFDIDNTMLSNNIGLGSEEWFYWQESLLKTKSKQKVANTFDGLLRVNGILYNLDPMKLTDKYIPTLLKNLQKNNFKTIVLTSRGSEFRNSTERVLSSHHLDFSNHKIGEDAPGLYIPPHGTRVVSYAGGIYMTSGQHKGEMLTDLLNKFSYKPDLVVFIDNHAKQTDRVFNSFTQKTNVVVYRYAGVDKIYKRFENKKVQAEADREFKRFKALVDKMFKTSIPEI